MSIQDSILKGTYKLSPLQLSPIRNVQKYRDVVLFPILYNEEQGMIPTLADSLVLTSLGRLIIKNWMKFNLLNDNIHGIRTKPQVFYEKLCSKGKVLRIYKLDLINSLKTLDRDKLMFFLKDFVNDPVIMEYVSSFLYVRVVNDRGVDISSTINCIPHVGILSLVLLDLALINFDNEFQRLFPGLDFLRYGHEVYVYTPMYSSPSVEENILDRIQAVSGMLENLNLSGKIITIEAGNEAVPCYGGVVSVRQNGEIKVKIKRKLL